MLLRKAGIKATPQPVTADSAAVLDLVGEIATQAPPPAPKAVTPQRRPGQRALSAGSPRTGQNAPFGQPAQGFSGRRSGNRLVGLRAGVEPARPGCGPHGAFGLGGTQDAVGGLKLLAGLLGIGDRPFGRAAHHHHGQGRRGHRRHHQQAEHRRASGDEHQPMTRATVAHLAATSGDIVLSCGVGELTVQLMSMPRTSPRVGCSASDQVGQFPRHRSGAGPPGAVDVSAENLGDGDSHRAGRSP